MTGPCPGSGTWIGWGWAWYPCPECRARIDVDEDTLSLVEHRRDLPIDRFDGVPIEIEPPGWD